MECNILTLEAIAHYIRGASTLFFIFWSFILRRYRHRSRMMRLLHLTAVILAVCYLKDGVFLVFEWKNSTYLNDLAGIMDMVYLPVMSSFFLEVAKPGAVSNRILYATIALQSVFVPLYILFPVKAVCVFSDILAYAISAATVIYMTLFVTQYRRRLFDCYSYTENIDVRWVLGFCYAYFFSLLLYSFSFESTTWTSETLFNMTVMFLWTAVFNIARRHRRLRLLVARGGDAGCQQPDNADDLVRQESLEEGREGITDKSGELPHIIDFVQAREAILGLRLGNVMTTRKPYLNPKLTIIDLATEMGTNKTYLSLYLNNTLHTTFYDLVNKYRVEHACGILSEMTDEDKKTMTEVAEASGFNSLSSFNRYFRKIMDISPSEYFLKHAKSNC